MKTLRCFLQLVLTPLGLACFVSAASAQGETTRQSTGSFQSGGAEITLSCCAPSADGKYPAIVLLNGLRSVMASKAVLDPICKGFATRGYAVFLVHYFDQTKTTDTDLEPLLAEFKDYVTNRKPLTKATAMKYRAWVDTVRDGLAHIRSHANVDGERVGLIGLSLGGFITMELAAEENHKLRAVVNCFGGMPPKVVPRLKSLPPTQVIHGGKDLVVPVNETEALKKLVDKDKSYKIEVHIYADAGHMFVSPKEEFQLRDALNASATAARFLENHLMPARPADSKGKR